MLIWLLGSVAPLVYYYEHKRELILPEPIQKKSGSSGILSNVVPACPFFLPLSHQSVLLLLLLSSQLPVVFNLGGRAPYTVVLAGTGLVAPPPAPPVAAPLISLETSWLVGLMQISDARQQAEVGSSVCVF